MERPPVNMKPFVHSFRMTRHEIYGAMLGAPGQGHSKRRLDYDAGLETVPKRQKTGCDLPRRIRSLAQPLQVNLTAMIAEDVFF